MHNNLERAKRFLSILFQPKLVLVVLVLCFVVDYISEAKYFPGFDENNFIVNFFVNYLIWYIVLGLSLPISKWLRVGGIKKYLLISAAVIILMVVAFKIPDSPVFAQELRNLMVLLSLSNFVAIIISGLLKLITFRQNRLTERSKLHHISLSSSKKIKFGKVFNVVLVIIIGIILWQNNQLNQRLDSVENKLGGPSRIACNEKDTIAKVRQSVVRIVGGESEGSGFAIKEGGTIVTNFHVIEFEPSPKVLLPDNTFETAEIITADKNADLAILKINKNLPVITWGRSEFLEPTDELLAIGYPFGGTLVGESSVNKGILAGTRFSKDNGIEYLQTDTTLNPGVSGGPMVDICGKVMGINTAGTAGLGLAISSHSFKDKQFDMIVSKDPLKDVKKITLEPNKSALDAVNAFYSYLKMRKMPDAFGMLSDNFKKGYDFNYWVKGYKPLLDNTAIKIEEDKKIPDRINIKLATKELIDNEIVYKYFEGYWDVKRVDEKWLLWDPQIKEVENPDYLWFYE